MRFSLQDIKKQVHRRGGELYVGLHFLRPGQLRTEIEGLIGYHEQLLGQPRREFSLDDARACIKDYRLAHCLMNTLSAWYQWRQSDWSETLQPMGSEAQKRLVEAGITSPAYLRLGLFNYVNEHYQGFLDAAHRSKALQAFATLYRLSVPDLEHLLVLDSDGEELLLRSAPHLPAAQDVAALYNQWVFEAALFNASQVHFVIDCNAYENNVKPQLNDPKATGTGVGAVIKRLCYLSRLLGVYYDLAYDAGAAALLHLTLYGPQEMTGTPQQYGLRLARLCRLLLGYGISQRYQRKDARGHSKHNNEVAGNVSGGQVSRVFTHAIVQAEATIHFLQRSYCFVIDNDVLSLLPSLSENNQVKENRETTYVVDQPRDAPGVFDSSIEQSFAEAFTALENSQAVDGWALIREPEPLLLAQSIFIPDFALTRAGKRIYIEILGFWTPTYRERKIQKLQQLRERGDIVLAIPLQAREAFTAIAASFPIVWYEGQLSVTELLSLLRNRFDDFASRLASIDIAAVRRRVESEGLLTERACYELMHCYRRSELALAAERVVGRDVAFVAGIGLYRIDWMEQLKNSFVEWIGSAAVLSLADVLHESRLRWPALANCEDTALEAMLGLWPEVRVRRSSIFEAVVEIVDSTFVDARLTASNTVDAINASPSKKPSPEKRSVQKKRVVKEAEQGNLWN